MLNENLDQYIKDLQALQEQLTKIQTLIGKPAPNGPPMLTGQRGVQSAVANALNECSYIPEILRNPQNFIKDKSDEEVYDFVNSKRLCLAIYTVARAIDFKDGSLAYTELHSHLEDLAQWDNFVQLKEEINKLNPSTLGGEIPTHVATVVAEQYPQGSEMRTNILQIVQPEMTNEGCSGPQP